MTLAASPAWLADAFFVGPAIVERLRAQMSSVLASVQYIADVDVERGPAQTPSAVVLLESEQPDDSPNGRRYDGALQIVTQTWLVYLVVSSAAQTTDASKFSAGPLYGRIARSLGGYKLPGAHRALVRTRSPRARYTPQRAYFPLAFAVQIVTP